MSRPGSQEICLTRSGRSGRSGRSCRSGLRLGYSTYFMSSFMPQPRLQSFWLEKKIILTNSVLSRSFSAWPMKGGHHTYFPGTPWNQHKTPWWCNTLNIYQEISVQASKWCAVHIFPWLGSQGHTRAIPMLFGTTQRMLPAWNCDRKLS